MAKVWLSKSIAGIFVLTCGFFRKHESVAKEKLRWPKLKSVEFLYPSLPHEHKNQENQNGNEDKQCKHLHLVLTVASQWLVCCRWLVLL